VQRIAATVWATGGAGDCGLARATGKNDIKGCAEAVARRRRRIHTFTPPATSTGAQLRKSKKREVLAIAAEMGGLAPLACLRMWSSSCEIAGRQRPEYSTKVIEAASPPAPPR